MTVVFSEKPDVSSLSENAPRLQTYGRFSAHFPPCYTAGAMSASKESRNLGQAMERVVQGLYVRSDERLAKRLTARASTKRRRQPRSACAAAAS